MSNNTTTTSDNIIFETFEIEFDAGPEPIFHGGELVTGALKIQLKKEIKINAIRIQFNGRAVWKGSSNQKRSEESLEKVYFNNEFILLERPPGHPLPGHFSWNPNFLYRLPFEFPLPKGCETSYEGPFGFIRYSARAFLEADEPNKARYLVKRLFTIISPPELQKLVPPPMEAISEKKNVRFGSCCCRGRIYAEVQLPKKVYAPGENIIGNFTMDSRTAKSAASEHIETRLIDRLMPIFIGSNGPKETAENKRIKKEGKNEMAQRVVVGRKLTKEDLTNVLENENDKGSNLITTSDVFFIRVPAVIPTLENEQQKSMVPDEPLDVTSEENEKFHRLLESPSTTTLRERKEPFFRIDYALQISIGSQVLLEIPIRVHQIPIFSKGIEFRPFPLSQQVAEPDEVEFIKIGAFTFTPFYPMYLESPKSISNDAENGPSVKNLEEIQILNGESTNTKVIEAGKHAGNVKQQKLNELHRDQNELKQHPLGAMPESTLLRENGQNEDGSSERRLEENQNKSNYEHNVLVVMNEDGSKTTVQTTEYLLNNGHEDQKQQQNKADSEDQNFEGQQQQHLDISMTG